MNKVDIIVNWLNVFIDILSVVIGLAWEERVPISLQMRTAREVSFRKPDGCSICFSCHGTADKGWWAGGVQVTKSASQSAAARQQLSRLCRGTGSILSAGPRQGICMRKLVMVVGCVCAHVRFCESMCVCVCVFAWVVDYVCFALWVSVVLHEGWVIFAWLQKRKQIWGNLNPGLFSSPSAHFVCVIIFKRKVCLF